MKRFIILAVINNVILPMAEEFVKKTSNPYDDQLVKGLKALAKAVELKQVK